MENRLISYFQKIINLTLAETEALRESIVVKTFAKGHAIVKEGQFSQDTYFVLAGCVRQFKVLDGNEITTQFFTEDQWIIAGENVEGATTSKYHLTCVEDTTVVVGNEQKAQALFKQFPRLETVSRQIMETIFWEQQQLMVSYITDKPEQRYLNLLATRPDLLQRVPQYDIATYIGVKPESLSRIRRKLMKKVQS
jgi:CRP-like cAMP-binding protein